MSKKLVESFIKLSDKIKTTIINGNIDQPISRSKWKIEVEGEFKNMSNQTSLKSLEKTVKDLFLIVNNLTTKVNDLTTTVNNLTTTVNDLTKTVNEGFAELRRDMKEVKSRLDVLESFHKDDFKNINKN